MVKTPRLKLSFTVRTNIGYGLKMQKLPKPEIDARVTEILEMCQLQPFAGRAECVSAAATFVGLPAVADSHAGAFPVGHQRRLTDAHRKVGGWL